MRTGLEVLFDDVSRLAGLRVGVCCNHTAVDPNLDHLLDRLAAAGISVRRVFAPEHGLHATAQDMIAVEGEDDGPAVVSLYGDSAASLRPDPALLRDLDVVLFDIQDIGTRYYTYQATLGYLMEVAATTGTRVIVLDRPNPIDGITIEGNLVQPGFESFVSAYPLPVRHGLTMGELALYFRDVLGIACALEVVKCEGWDPTQRFDATGLPWVYPSPNMPTLETALLYPGMCLIEGTNLSEGRGTTRPFHLVGAPWLDASVFTRLCRQGAIDNELAGVAFRTATFEPRFQKFAGKVCHGVEVTITNPDQLESFLLGLVVLEAALRAAPSQFKWRTETYEFVDTPIAIDLLCGSAEARVGLESRVRPRDLLNGWKGEIAAWEEVREGILLYGRG
ncbi:MAG: DUF1343 domain-containing protein [Pseudomonadota bacterium]|nr:DUF1343 domain-containing protein [Pseudomonadota bacterium]